MDVYMVSASGKIGGVNGRYVSGSTVDARKATLLICVSSTPGGTYANNTGRWIFIQDNANHIFNANSKMTGYVLGNDDSAITIDDNILEAISKIERRLIDHINKNPCTLR
eukprot:TRINITY_DN7523_c0_g1_i5.p3 TRINITY_DN7523_c0_g1~~TRINITY_DN7523_c0_g1_i5.p3  ORF type:complete len:110 (-),score=4.29 TRINITY_DN7523_c0_g1_i5:184-513(-)